MAKPPHPVEEMLARQGLLPRRPPGQAMAKPPYQTGAAQPPDQPREPIRFSITRPQGPTVQRPLVRSQLPLPYVPAARPLASPRARVQLPLPVPRARQHASSHTTPLEASDLTQDPAQGPPAQPPVSKSAFLASLKYPEDFQPVSKSAFLASLNTTVSKAAANANKESTLVHAPAARPQAGDAARICSTLPR